MSFPSNSDQDYHPLPTAPDAPDPASSDAMGNDEHYLKPEARPGDLLAGLAAVTAAAVLLIVTWILILINHPGALSWFAFHPTFNTLAILVFALSILQLQPTSQPKTKAVGLQRHQLGMIIGLPLVLVGSSAIFYNKSVHGAPHFTTWHGTFGIISLTWLVVQSAFGAASVWFGGAALGGGMKAKRLWKYHRLSGYVLFPLVLLTVNLGGAYSGWVVDHTALVVRLLTYTVAPIVLLVALYIRIRPSKMQLF
ncbi:hypothetical protein OF83DRAFT_1121964 [Amylostereum chailletii]|nr:hypothetical protein OF83DRAFT_1121964 [Amylostereum chailletii]